MPVYVGSTQIISAYKGGTKLTGAYKGTAPVRKTELAFVAALSDASATTYTFTGVDFGDADPTREIFVTSLMLFSTTRTAASLTIGGVAGTIATGHSEASGSGVWAGFAKVPSGTSGTVTFTMSGACLAAYVLVYRVVNRPGRGSNESDSSFNTTTGGTSLAVAATTIPDNGFMLGTHLHSNNNASSSSLLSVDDDRNFGTARVSGGFYSKIAKAGATPTQTWSWSGSVSGRAATWAFG